MDHLTPPTSRSEIESAALDAGITPRDPAWPMVQLMIRMAENAERAVERIKLAREIPADQLRDIVHAAARHMEARTFHMVVAANRGLVLGSVLAVLLALGIGIGGGWFIWGAGMTCADQAGGRVCYVWTAPPTSAGGQAR